MAELHLRHQVLDMSIVSRDMRRCGKVDDLVLEWDPNHPSTRPKVRGIVTGPTALADQMPGPVRAAVRVVYRLAGLTDPEPIVIPWKDVELIGVIVQLNVDRKDVKANVVANAVRRRFIKPIPGA